MSDWDLDLQRAIFNSLNPVRTARCNISSTRVELSAATRRSTRLEREGIVPVQRNFRSDGKKWNASSSSIPKDTKSTVLTRSVRGAKLPTETKASSTDPGRKEYLHDPLKDTIMSDVILKNTGTIAWNDVIGLTDAKRLLKEAVVLPQLAPELFSGFRCPWRGILLYGPPGTGKTLLAKAVASEVNATFINVSASTLISKYHGESEKLVRTLFEVAYEKAPSVLFFDEIDTLFSTRSSNEHDALKRLKGQFLSECDGLLSKQNIFVIATTNRPWDIDDALRRRLEKRIYIPLPDAETRISLFKHNLKNTCLEDDVDLNQLADLTQGYSGADINIICREAFMHPVRRLLSSGDFDSDTIKHLREAGELQNNRLLVSMKDFESSIEKTKPSNAQSADCSYEVWTQEYGSV